MSEFRAVCFEESLEARRLLCQVFIHVCMPLLQPQTLRLDVSCDSQMQCLMMQNSCVI